MMLGKTIFSVIVLTLCGGGTAFGQVIRLRAQTTVEMHQEVRLGDFATVTAEDPRKAQQLANTVILSDVDHPQKIKAEAVLMALMAQQGPATLGNNFQISGAAVCEFLVNGPVVSARLGQSNRPATLDVPAPVTTGVAPVVTATVVSGAVPKAAPATVVPAADTGPMTLRKAIFAAVQQGLAISEDDIKVSVDTLSPLVDEPVAAGRKWQCRALTRTLVGSVPFETQLTEGTKIIAKLNVLAQVSQRQMVVVLTAPVTRRTVITAAQARVEESWTDRRQPTLFGSLKDVVGLEAQKDMDAGAKLDQRDFRPMFMAHKNDLITVIYVAGALEVQSQARALDDGKLHDQLPLRNEQTGEKYTAVVVGKNKAVVGTLTAEQETRIREAE